MTYEIFKKKQALLSGGIAAENGLFLSPLFGEAQGGVARLAGKSGGFDGLGNTKGTPAKEGGKGAHETQIAGFMKEVTGPFDSFKGLSDLPGYDTEKSTISGLIGRFVTRQIAMHGKGKEKEKAEERVKLQPAATKGYILYGPGGTGKSQYGRATVREIATKLKPHGISPVLFDINVNTMFSEYQGETQAQLTQGLDQMRARPLIVVFDEADGLYNPNAASTAQIQSANILKQWLSEIANDPEVMVIMITNNVNSLPEPLKRPGRFDAVIKMDYPSNEDKVKILHYYKHKYEMSSKIPFASDISWEEAARSLNGGLATGATIEGFMEHLGDRLAELMDGVQHGTLPVILSGQKKGKKGGTDVLLKPEGNPADFPQTAEDARKRFQTGIDPALGKTPADFGLEIDYNEKTLVIEKVKVMKITADVFSWAVERFNQTQPRTLKSVQTGL